MGLMQIRIDTWGPKVWKSWRTLCLDCVVVCKKIAFHPLAHPRPSATWFQSGFSFPKFPAFWREASGIPYTSMVKAWTIGTFSLTANPKSLTDPTTLVFIVWTGFFLWAIREAGGARLIIDSILTQNKNSKSCLIISKFYCGKETRLDLGPKKPRQRLPHC